MLFHVTPEDHIRVIKEPGPADSNAGGSTFASEQEFEELANEWPMKRLVEIWNRLPGVERVARFTDRKTAIRRIWRALQPQRKRVSERKSLTSWRRSSAVWGRRVLKLAASLRQH
jgi:hypothetical protein